jgi:hypothetical protein
MTEHQRQAAERPAAERYYAQYAALEVGPGGFPRDGPARGDQRGSAPELEADQRDERPN